MKISTQELAIEAAKNFLVELGVTYEEPITVSLLRAGVYKVAFRPEGFSNPGWVIDPDLIEVLVDTDSENITLVPAM